MTDLSVYFRVVANGRVQSRRNLNNARKDAVSYRMSRRSVAGRDIRKEGVSNASNTQVLRVRRFPSLPSLRTFVVV